jgi:hypothetical protein
MFKDFARLFRFLTGLMVLTAVVMVHTVGAFFDRKDLVSESEEAIV